MAAHSGREILLKRGSTVLAGIRTKGIAFSGEPVDVTTDDDDGYRRLLSVAGQVGIDISFDGITEDAEIRSTALTGALELTDIVLEYPNGDAVTGTFFLNSFEETGTYNDSVTFTGSLQSSGPWTYTAAAN